MATRLSLLASDLLLSAGLVPECWEFGPAAACCHPQHGPGGFQGCWRRPHIDARECCNESDWVYRERNLFHFALQRSYADACASGANRSGTAHRRWLASSVSDEMGYWLDYLRGGPQEYLRGRVPGQVVRASRAIYRDLDEPLQSLLRDWAGQRQGGALRVLDLGSGPFSVLGSGWKDVAVEVTAVDALACHYNLLRRDLRMLNRFGGRERRPIRAEAEQLTAALASAEIAADFDAVHCSNALDHVYDPLAALSEMLRAAKVGAPVLLVHARNSGERERYEGLHKWNFDVDRGRFLLWKRGSRDKPVDLSAGLAQLGLVDLPSGVDARLLVRAAEGNAYHAGIGRDEEWVQVVLRRRPGTL